MALPQVAFAFLCSAVNENDNGTIDILNVGDIVVYDPVVPDEVPFIVVMFRVLEPAPLAFEMLAHGPSGEPAGSLRPTVSFQLADERSPFYAPFPLRAVAEGQHQLTIRIGDATAYAFPFRVRLVGSTAFH